MNKRKLSIVLAAALLTAGACGGGGSDGGEEAAGNEEGGSADTLPVTMTASDFKFEPESLEGHATHSVDLTFVNEGDVEHSFTIDEMGVDVEAEGGQEATETFTPEETGTFEFYCKYHPDTMTGEFTVS